MTANDERAAKQDITEVLVRYATGIDRRDWDLFRTCFTPDCHADYGDIGVWEGVDAITAFMTEAHANVGHTLHRLTNVAITVDDDRAAARTYVDAIIMATDGQSGIHTIGFYDDELVPTDDGWRIARRAFTMAQLSTIGT